MIDSSLFVVDVVLDIDWGQPAYKYWMFTTRLLPLVCDEESVVYIVGCREALLFVNFVNNFVDSDHESKIRISKELGE